MLIPIVKNQTTAAEVNDLLRLYTEITTAITAGVEITIKEWLSFCNYYEHD